MSAVYGGHMLPREKLTRHGPARLNNDELLAILLAHGTTRENVFQISKRIIEAYENHALLRIESVHDFKRLWDVNLNHAQKLCALLELGYRLFQRDKEAKSFQRADDVVAHLQGMKTLDQEQTRALYLTVQNNLIGEEIVSIGTLTASLIDFRTIFRHAIKYNAAAFILAHNHPSGNPQPSDDDIRLTRQLYESAALMNIPMLDHVIVAKRGYFSFEKSKIYVPSAR